MKRDSGQYWPSIVQCMPSGVTSLFYTVETRQLFIGQENGTISEFSLAADFNRIMPVREYLAHQARITEVIFALNCEWVLSVSRDKTFSYNCTQTGRNIGTFTAEAWCTSLQYVTSCILMFECVWKINCLVLDSIRKQNMRLLGITQGRLRC